MLATDREVCLLALGNACRHQERRVRHVRITGCEGQRAECVERLQVEVVMRERLSQMRNVSVGTKPEPNQIHHPIALG